MARQIGAGSEREAALAGRAQTARASRNLQSHHAHIIDALKAARAGTSVCQMLDALAAEGADA